MPSTTIDVCMAYTEAEEVAIIEAVHRVQAEALGISPSNRNLILRGRALRGQATVGRVLPRARRRGI